MADNLADLIEEKQRRAGQVTGGTRSVLAEPEDTSNFEEFKRFTTSLLKGSTAGLIEMAGGWGNVYNALKSDKTTPSPLSGQGVIKAIAEAGGPDLMKIQGYKGAYNFGRAAAPAAALTAAGVPGLFGRTAPGIAGEFGVAGTLGAASQEMFSDSPLAQFALQSAPYALMGGIRTGREFTTRPTGKLPSVGESDALLYVGRMTPGELTGSRPQLAKEARVEVKPQIEERANIFRQAQAKDIEGFVTDVFNKTTRAAGSVEEAASNAMNAFNNYGKALSSRLSRSAKADFKEAKAAGGQVDTTSVLSVLDEKLAALPPEIAALDPMRNALNRIKSEYLIPGTEASITPSTILGPTGQPAAITTTAATPASARSIDIDRLQKNLSAWGEAAYSGKADFGKGNIFEGVAPGQAKGIAISILGGFRDALDNAIANNVPGAEKLLKARDNFKNNLSQIEEFSNRPLTKYFDVPIASALTPEGVIDKLSKAKPSERLFLAEVLSYHPEGSLVWDTVRRSQLDALVEKARKAAGGAAEGSPEIDLNVLLKELNNKKGDFGYLLDPTAKSDINLAMQWLRKVAKGATEGETSLKGDIYGATRGVGGSSQTGLLLGEAASLARVILENPKAIADVVFNPNTVKKLVDAKAKSTPQKIVEAIRDVATTTGQQALRTGPRIGGTEEPMVEGTQMVAPSAQEDELKSLKEELRLRTEGAQQ